MSASSTGNVLDDEMFQACFANDAWKECVDILQHYGINPLCRASRRSGYPEVLYDFDPLAPEWFMVSVSRHIYFQSPSAVIAGYLVACATGIRKAEDEGCSLEVQRRYMRAAISELRFLKSLTPPWLEVYGAIVGTFMPGRNDIKLLNAYDIARLEALEGAVPAQRGNGLRIQAILGSNGYCLNPDDYRAVAALSAMSIAYGMVPVGEPRRDNYGFEVLDIIRQASRPQHVAWEQIRKEMF